MPAVPRRRPDAAGSRRRCTRRGPWGRCGVRRGRAVGCLVRTTGRPCRRPPAARLLVSWASGAPRVAGRSTRGAVTGHGAGHDARRARPSTSRAGLPTLTERVTAVDALAQAVRKATLDDYTGSAEPAPRRPSGRRGIPAVLALVDARSESPMESRARIALHVGGLPPPAVQHAVTALAVCPVPARPRVPGGAAGHRVRRRGPPHPAALGPARPGPRGGAHRSRLAHPRFDADAVLCRPVPIAQVVRAELAARGISL